MWHHHVYEVPYRLHASGSGWTHAGIVADFLVAMFTLALAIATVWLGRQAAIDAKEARRIAEQGQQIADHGRAVAEQSRDLQEASIRANVDPALVFESLDGSRTNNGPTSVCLTVVNVGNGPAISIEMDAIQVGARHDLKIRTGLSVIAGKSARLQFTWPSDAPPFESLPGTLGIDFEIYYLNRFGARMQSYIVVGPDLALRTQSLNGEGMPQWQAPATGTP